MVKRGNLCMCVQLTWCHKIFRLQSCELIDSKRYEWKWQMHKTISTHSNSIKWIFLQNVDTLLFAIYFTFYSDYTLFHWFILQEINVHLTELSPCNYVTWRLFICENMSKYAINRGITFMWFQLNTFLLVIKLSVEIFTNFTNLFCAFSCISD